MKIGWNSESLARLGGIQGVYRSRIFDANGLEWKEGITWCDTETGEIERFMYEKRTIGRRDIPCEIFKAAAPLIVVTPSEEG